MVLNQTSSNKSRKETLLSNYPPSWFNRFSAWVDKLPIPGWIVYLLVSIVFIIIGLFIQWLEGSGGIRDWDPIFIVAIFQISIIFIIIHYLDKNAVRVLEEFKSALKPEGADSISSLKRAISTMPARKAFLYCLFFMTVGVFLVLGAVLGGEQFGSTINVSISPFGFYTGIAMLLLWYINGLLVYHTIHQLGMVNTIYTELAVVHPFHQKELFAFSGFSARTGISIVMITPLWIIFDPGPISLVICIVFAIFGLIAFIYPLTGVQRLLSGEKDQLLDENGKQIEKTISLMMKELKNDGLADLDLADRALSSLEKAKNQIEQISTWPWKTETIRQLLTAIILPLLIWLIQYLLSSYVF